MDFLWTDVSSLLPLLVMFKQTKGIVFCSAISVVNFYVRILCCLHIFTLLSMSPRNSFTFMYVLISLIIDLIMTLIIYYY